MRRRACRPRRPAPVCLSRRQEATRVILCYRINGLWCSNSNRAGWPSFSLVQHQSLLYIQPHLAPALDRTCPGIREVEIRVLGHCRGRPSETSGRRWIHLQNWRWKAAGSGNLLCRLRLVSPEFRASFSARRTQEADDQRRRLNGHADSG